VQLHAGILTDAEVVLLVMNKTTGHSFL